MNNQEINNSAQTLIKELSTHLFSGIGTIFLRTNEHERASDVITDLAISVNTKAMLWNMNTGLKCKETDKPIGSKNEYKVLDKALDYFMTSNIEYDYLIIQWPHFILPRSPQLIQNIDDLTLELSSSEKRIIMVIPNHSDIPEELSQIPTISMNLPTQDEMEDILNELFDIIDEDLLPNYSSGEITQICKNATGLTAMEAENIFSMVTTESREILSELPYQVFAERVSKFKTDIVNKAETLEVLEPIPLNQVGGLEVLKDDIKIIRECLTPEAEDLGIPKPKGILLVGNPGGGKSLCAQAISSELNIPLIKFDVSRIFGSLVGSSEKNMKKAIDTIEAINSCVVMVDEVDKVFSQTGGNDSGTGQRVLGTLLTKMQEGSKNGGTIYWVLTANRVDNLPAELVRKGRLDEIYAITYPNKTERLAIANIHLNKLNIEAPEDLNVFIDDTEKFVGAEIESAIITSMRESYFNNNDTEVTGNQLLEVIHRSKSTYEAFKEQAEEMSSWAENHAKQASLIDSKINISKSSTKEPVKRSRKFRHLN